MSDRIIDIEYILESEILTVIDRFTADMADLIRRQTPNLLNDVADLKRRTLKTVQDHMRDRFGLMLKIIYESTPPSNRYIKPAKQVQYEGEQGDTFKFTGRQTELVKFIFNRVEMIDQAKFLRVCANYGRNWGKQALTRLLLTYFDQIKRFNINLIPAG